MLKQIRVDAPAHSIFWAIAFASKKFKPIEHQTDIIPFRVLTYYLLTF